MVVVAEQGRPPFWQPIKADSARFAHATQEGRICRRLVQAARGIVPGVPDEALSRGIQSRDVGVPGPGVRGSRALQPVPRRADGVASYKRAHTI